MVISDILSISSALESTEEQRETQNTRLEGDVKDYLAQPRLTTL